MELAEEDPVEQYKREFKRKRWEAEKAAKDRRIKYESRVHRILRYLAFPIALFALILLLDQFLPPEIYHEVAELGWQNRVTRRDNTRYSYMQTASFIISVPAEAHINYPYYERDKPELTIEVTPVFNVPLHASFTLNGVLYSFYVDDNIFLLVIPLSWFLLISAIIIIVKRKYTRYIFNLSFMPIVLLLLVLWKMYGWIF